MSITKSKEEITVCATATYLDICGAIVAVFATVQSNESEHLQVRVHCQGYGEDVDIVIASRLYSLRSVVCSNVLNDHVTQPRVDLSTSKFQQRLLNFNTNNILCQHSSSQSSPPSHSLHMCWPWVDNKSTIQAGFHKRVPS